MDILTVPRSHAVRQRPNRYILGTIRAVEFVLCIQSETRLLGKVSPRPFISSQASLIIVVRLHESALGLARA